MTPPDLPTVLATHTREAQTPLLALAVLFGLAAIWAGVRVWQGRFQPTYRTFWGAAPAVVLAGTGFVVIAVGELVRGARDLPVDGGLFWAFSVAGFAAIALAGAYALAYLWIGVPDALRPPYQRDRAAGDAAPPPDTAEPVAPGADGVLRVHRANRSATPVVTVTPTEVVVHRRRGRIRIPHRAVADVYVARGGPGHGSLELTVELHTGSSVSEFTDRAGRFTDTDVRHLYRRPDGTPPDGPVVPAGGRRLVPDAPVAAASIRDVLDRAGHWTPAMPRRSTGPGPSAPGEDG